MTKKEDVWDVTAARMMKMRSECKSLKKPEAFERYIAEQLRRAHKIGAASIRDVIREALEIKDPPDDSG